MESVENPNPDNSTEKHYFKILGGHLVGRTEAELTPEEKEAEAQFCKENFSYFLEWINSDQVLVHAISGREKSPISSVFELGILSRFQLDKLNIRAGIGRDWQEGAQMLANVMIERFIKSYKDFRDGNLNEEDFENAKKEIIKLAPAVGEKRIAYFLDKVIPNIIENIGYPIKFKSVVSNPNTEDIPDSKNPFSGKPNYSPPNISSEEYKNFDVWQSLPAIMSGLDLVSSTSSTHMKNDFLEKKRFLSSVHPSGIHIYFEKPDELRMYELTMRVQRTSTKYSGEDIGISNKIHPNRFKAIRFGYYDQEKRIFYSDQTPENIQIVMKAQESGLVVLDSCLVPVPLLGTINIQNGNFDSKIRTLNHTVTPYRHPEYTYELIGRVKKAVSDGKIERVSSEDLEKELSEDYFLNLILNNQNKSLATIEEMGGVHSSTHQ